MIKLLIKKHWPIIIPALLLGVLMVLPFFYFEAKLGKDFKGVFPEIVNDSTFYYARIKDIVDGHPMLGNAYLFEHKSELPQGIFLGEYLLAQPIRWLHLNINTARLIYNFLLPAMAFILCYSVLFLISKSRRFSGIISAFLFFGFFPLDFIRPVSPQFNFLFWLSQLILLLLLIENKNSRPLLFLNIFSFGLLFYIYPYYWTFFAIFLSLILGVNFFIEKEFFYKIFSIIAGGFALALPYFYLNYKTSLLPEYGETMTRLGMIYTRFPSGINIILLGCFGFLMLGYLIWRKSENRNFKTAFFFCGILASILAVNQHIITGRNIEFSSHYSMGAMFFLVFSLAYVWSALEKEKNLKWLFRMAGAGVLAVLISGMANFSNRVSAINSESAYSQKYAPIFAWLNQNTLKDSVVYANEPLSRLIPVYTSNNVFYIREANLFFISDREILDRFILNNFFENFNKDFIIENVRSIYGVRYIDKYGHAVQSNKLRRILRMKPEPEIYLPDEAIQKVVSRAQELQRGDFIKELYPYRVDYFIWDKNQNPDWRFDPKYFKNIFETDSIIIFKSI